MTKKKQNLPKENEDNVFVYKESVEAVKNTLTSVRRSIENERTKAGILIGFFGLIVVTGLPYFEKLPMFLRGVCFVLIIFILVFLIQAFCSKKMQDGVDVEGNFKEDWTNRKLEFLKFYHDIIKGNIENQKRELTSNSNKIKYSIILLAIVIIILFLNHNLPMFNKIFDGGNNPMKPSTSENSPSTVENSSNVRSENVATPDSINTSVVKNPMRAESLELSESGSNPMTSQTIEKGADNK